VRVSPFYIYYELPLTVAVRGNVGIQNQTYVLRQGKESGVPIIRYGTDRAFSLEKNGFGGATGKRTLIGRETADQGNGIDLASGIGVDFRDRPRR
jgi:hypothetical protein